MSEERGIDICGPIPSEVYVRWLRTTDEGEMLEMLRDAYVALKASERRGDRLRSGRAHYRKDRNKHRSHADAAERRVAVECARAEAAEARVVELEAGLALARLALANRLPMEVVSGTTTGGLVDANDFNEGERES